MKGLARRITVGLTTVVAAASMVVAPAPAAAATMAVHYDCAGMMVGGPKTFDITITAPATATRGVPVTVTVKIQSHVPLAVDADAGDYRVYHSLVLGGAVTSSHGMGPMTNPPFDEGELWWVTGSTQLTFDTAGTVTYKPGHITFHAPGAVGCRPKDASTVPVLAGTQVS
ncbi:hypothetical protein [Actinophytocola algeriensis]|uniref:Dehydratase n=1 Tax=Actinophytocola algeriensis TaxID=1768010 RepID=A0A7W7Q136_9PSEU|nr:hypothetical protein [Actinophytocola algeriensis]MBB4905060.1 hypothetical protein [Actinophytocola algeriensis]MBE1473255.1 hypothetical protein [Actinophytocola algeriensis]